MVLSRKAPPPVAMDGFIGPGMEVEGTIRFKNLLRVDGRLKGRVESYERLVVGSEGRVEAEVIVGSLEVHGVVSGRISVDDRVEILPGARVEGELFASAPAVHISEGGVFDGELFMLPEKDDDEPEDRRRTAPAPEPGTRRQDP